MTQKKSCQKILQTSSNKKEKENCEKKINKSSFYLYAHQNRIYFQTKQWVFWLFFSLFLVGILLLFFNETSIVSIPLGETKQVIIEPYWIGVGILCTFGIIAIIIFFMARKEIYLD